MGQQVVLWRNIESSSFYEKKRFHRDDKEGLMTTALMEWGEWMQISGMETLTVKARRHKRQDMPTACWQDSSPVLSS